MTFWGFIIIICKVLIALVGLVLLIVLVNALLFLRILYRALPSWKSVSPSDKVWTSDVYAKHFISPEKWRYIETFLYETFIPYDQIRPELVDNENAFTSEVFRLLWDARNAYGKIYPSPSIEGPIIGSIGGSESIRAEVVHRSDFEVAFVITTVEGGYVGGFETVEVEMLETGAMIELKYIWHNPHAPRPWKFQWLGIYIQLMGRSMWLSDVVAGVAKIKAPAEEVDNQHRDL